VEAAIAQRRTRNGRFEERALELMTKDLIRIDVKGAKVGQVNGLSVLDAGYHRFGKPTRITASSSVGRAGIINIEREARLSGGIYDKGVLIVTGWLRRRYAQDRALTLTASLCFEQSYAGVDGDSASIAELIALLSELSGIAVDQAVAVTGSLDQHGSLQPIGGLNEKVEGFFDLCQSRGLTGDQGVMFPEANVAELNLRQDAAEAIEAGHFSLYALRQLDDALEISTGAPMVEIDKKVIAKLEEYSSILSESPADFPPAQVIPASPLSPVALPPSQRGVSGVTPPTP
jgi:predicted ATP-dependent protease